MKFPALVELFSVFQRLPGRIVTVQRLAAQPQGIQYQRLWTPTAASSFVPWDLPAGRTTRSARYPVSSLPLSPGTRSARFDNLLQDSSPNRIIYSSTSLFLCAECGIYPSFEELTLRSDRVVIGYINAEKQIINTARDPDDLDKPDPEYYSVGQIYNLQVDQYFKGEGPNSINLIQNQGFLVLDDGKQPSMEEIESAKRVKNYVQVEFNKPYLLFLRDISKYYEEYQMTGLYTGTAEPWIFDYTNPDCVPIEGPDQSLARYFPPQPSSMINEKIASAQDGKITNDTLPYPAPLYVGESLCYPDSIKPYP